MPTAMVQISSSGDGSRKLRSKKASSSSAVGIIAPFLVVVLVVASSALYLTFRWSSEVRLRRKRWTTPIKIKLAPDVDDAAKAAAASQALRNPQAIISEGLPFLVYGTAWKKELTSRYVADALRAGFRFFDTACQPKHYHEAGVGDGWTEAAHELGLSRHDVFLQTKFTPDKGQDPDKIPYNRTAPIEDQVRQSFAMSLTHLRTDYVDSLVMHSPLPSMEDTMRVWKTMETLVDDGTVKVLGISNCYDYKTFVHLYESARIKPKVLQNRFYATTNFDTDLRAFCRENGIWYQSFWTLTANRKALGRSDVQELAHGKGLTPQTLLYAFLMQLGHTPLSGTTSREHMKEDVAVMERLQLGERVFANDKELRRIAALLGMPGL